MLRHVLVCALDPCSGLLDSFEQALTRGCILNHDFSRPIEREEQWFTGFLKVLKKFTLATFSFAFCFLFWLFRLFDQR